MHLLKSNILLCTLAFAIVGVVGLEFDSALASGNITHQVISDKAINMMQERQARNILNNNKDAFRTGVLHPDVVQHGSLIGKVADWANAKCDADVRGASGHLPFVRGKPAIKKNWVSKYLELLRLHCLDQYADCKKEIAYLFGAVSHMVEDARFDKEFAGLNSGDNGETGIGIIGNCPHLGIPGLSNDGRNLLATAFTDKDLDICLGKKIADPAGVEKFANSTYDHPRYAGARSKNPARRCPGSNRYDFKRKACYKCPRGFKWTYRSFTNNVYAEQRACRRQMVQCAKMANPGYSRIPMPNRIVVPDIVAKAYKLPGTLPFDTKMHIAKTGLAAKYYKFIRPKHGEGSFRTKGLVTSREPFKYQQAIMYCDWALTHFVSEGINKRAREVAEFLDKLWIAMIPRDQPLTMFRPSQRNITVEKHGKDELFVLYE